ncbi:hypothetical protein IQ264_15510 [Phormidium sp. LEGE 05292]|nr:hypothetical protein [Phormidium sp. LEGE 05292]MBE9226834.1 hypothetical protein [Phormidium sp. LEGE 05292]
MQITSRTNCQGIDRERRIAIAPSAGLKNNSAPINERKKISAITNA